MTIRLIPRLDIKGPNLVKGVHLEGLRVLGKPEDFARHYYEAGADELLYLDSVASLYGRNSLNDIIELTAREIFIPLCVGGGLRTVADMRSVLRAGADKIAVNSAAHRRPELIREAAQSFGSSTVVVSIQATKALDGSWTCMMENGREPTGTDAFEWALRAVELGAGELLITSIDREGTGEGFDVELVAKIADAVPVPVLACGGAGRVSHIYDLFGATQADGVCLASILHYNAMPEIAFSADDFVTEGNIDFRKTGGSFKRFEPASIPSIKRELQSHGVEVRMV